MQLKHNEQTRYEVKVDYENLHAGDHWRSKLLSGLGTCEAGIVLLNQQAILSSEWVHTEASILRWRNWLKECFPLILVFLGAESRTAFNQAQKWHPLAFSEVQFLAGGKEMTGQAMSEAAFDELVKVLGRREERPNQSRYELLRDGIESRLKRAAVDDLQKRANSREEAERLLAKGPAGIHDLLQRWSFLLEKGQKLDLIHFIAPWWVSPASSCLLAAASDPEAQHTDFSVTGKYVAYTPRMYVQHACVQPPDSSWKVVVVTARGGHSEGPALHDSIVNEVRQGLVSEYQNAWPDPQSVDDDEIKLQIDASRKAGQPTFVALPNHVAGDAAVRKAILTAFPGVVFLHLTATPQQAIVIAGCEALVPLPDPDREHEAYVDYRGALGRI